MAKKQLCVHYGGYPHREELDKRYGDFPGWILFKDGFRTRVVPFENAGPRVTRTVKMKKRISCWALLSALCMVWTTMALPNQAHADPYYCEGGTPDGKWQPDRHEQCDAGADDPDPGCLDCVVQDGYVCSPKLQFDDLVAETYPYQDGTPVPENLGGKWSLGTFSGTQLVNSYNATLAYMGADAKAMAYEVSISVKDKDDDFIGFALGFRPGDTTNPNARYLYIDWKGAEQTGLPSGTSYSGMKLSYVEGAPLGSHPGVPGAVESTEDNEFWISGGSKDPNEKTDHITVLQWADNGYGKNGIGWKAGSTGNQSHIFLFDIQYESDSLVVKLKNQSLETDWVTVFDVTPDTLANYDAPTFPSGQLAFFGLSQGNATYTLEGDHTTSCRFIDLNPSPDTRTVDGVSSVTFSAAELASNDGLDADPTRVTVRLTGADGPQFGTVVNNGDGTYTYTPNGGSTANPFNDEDVFTYEICGKQGLTYNWNTVDECQETTVTITRNVTAPQFANDSIDILIGSSGTYVVQDDATSTPGSYAIDYSTTTINVSAQVTVLGVGVSNVNDEITITIPSSYNGPDSFDFTYTVQDNRGNVSSPATTLTVYVIYPPVLSTSDAFETTAGCDLITGCVDSFDVEDALDGTPTHPLDPSTLTIVSDNAPADVTVAVDNGKIKVTAPADYPGTTSPFTVQYTIQDDQGNLSNEGALAVTVLPQQDVHITKLDGDNAVNNMYTTNPTPVFSGTSHPNTTIGIELDGTSYTATTNAAGAWTWTAEPLVPGTYTITATGTNSSTESLTFDVVAPFGVTDDTLAGAQGADSTTTIANLLSNDKNHDGSFILVAGSARNGSVQVDGTDVIFTTADDAETASFQYTTCAAYHAGLCLDATVNIIPLVKKPSANTATFWSLVDVARTVPNPFSGTVTTTIDGATADATATVEADGSIQVVPDAGYVGPVVVSLTACTQTTPAACGNTDFTVMFNDLPVIENDGASRQVSPGGVQRITVDADPQSIGEINWNTLAIDGNADTDDGTCSVDVSNKRVVFTAASGAAEGSNNPCTIIICEKNPTIANDGVEACTTATYAFGVTSSFFAEDDTLYTHQNTPLEFTADDLLENDNGYDPTSFEINNPGADADTWETTNGGTVTINDDGNFVYTPPADDANDGPFVGEDTFSYTVCPAVNDGTPCADDVQVTIQVEAAPTAVGTTIWVKTGTPSVDVALDDLFSANRNIGAVNTPSTVTDLSGDLQGSANGCMADDSDCGSAADGSAFVHFVPADVNAPAQYGIPTSICDDAPTPACTDEVAITIIYNEPPILGASNTIVTPGGKKTVNLDADTDTIASPGEQGTIDWGSLQWLDEDGNATDTPITDGNVTCSINGRTVVIEATEDAQIGDTGSCTFILCEVQPENTCSTGVLTFEVQNIFDPSDDSLTTIENTPLPIDPWEDLVRNDGNTDYPDSFVLIPDGEDHITTINGGTVTIDPNDPSLLIYTPDEDFTGVDTFTYTICSSIKTGDCADVDVTIHVLHHVRITAPNPDEPVDTISGSAEPGSQVTLTIGGHEHGPVTVDEDGHWSIDLDAPLASGDHTITATTDYNDSDTLDLTIQGDDKENGDNNGDGDGNDDDDDENNGGDGDENDGNTTPNGDIVVSGGRIGSCASTSHNPSTPFGILAVLAGLAFFRRRKRVAPRGEGLR